MFEQAKQLEFETSILGKNTEERLAAIAVRELEAKGIDVTSKNIQMLVAQYKDAIKTNQEQARLAEIAGQTESARIEKQRQDIQLITRELEAGRINQEQYLERVGVVLNQQTTLVKETTDDMVEFFKQAARNMQNAMSDFFFNIMQGRMTNLVGDFKNMIDRMVAELLASKLLNLLMGDFGKTGSLGGVLGGLFGGFRAGGGPVEAGKAYAVGEKGVELFTPNTSGTIIPNNELAGVGSNMVVNFNVSAVDSRSFLQNLEPIRRELTSLVAQTARTNNIRMA